MSEVISTYCVIMFAIFLFTDEKWYNIVMWPLAAIVKILKQK